MRYFEESMVFSVCFLHTFLQDKYASVLMWSGCRKRSCQGWMWMRCRWQQLSQDDMGVDPLPFLDRPMDLTLPSQDCPSSSLSWFSFVKGWDFRFRHRRQPMALNKPLPMKWITRRVRRFTRRPGRAVRFVGERWVGKNLTTFFAAIKHF